MIREFPRAWPAYSGETRRYCLLQQPYFFVYRVRATCVEVIGLFHERQEPDEWLDRITSDTWDELESTIVLAFAPRLRGVLARLRNLSYRT